MLKKYFLKVEKTNSYEGRDSKNPLAFQFYNKNQKISTKTMVMMIILNQNGLGSGRLNFDKKVRRSSNDPTDIFQAHCGEMDTYARGHLIAHKIIEDNFSIDK